MEDIMTERFNPNQLDVLRAEFAKIERIDPCLPTYDKMIKLLDGMPIEQLRQIHQANIRFLSKLAANRLMRATPGQLRLPLPHQESA